ncbi:Rieske 2Fe-2S domain-containing protein [Candidatus Entotheonella palauensis]|uniref:Rieske 2Fe-2S domain-containing protein n=1 Tax=Candidatus Entotheonella palauensis TaxID=93172 RepID=UPI000B7D4870|nr:Rieske 2Fe-2S domain-containing protein [Candidatus Entotheonella palauensis]
MLSTEDNELLCRVGPGTPMGNVMREYWIPALPASEFSTPDSPVKRMRLLGENLVMFRDTQGRMGALAEACPHRGASLYFGRNEDCGLRCVYHGWKFDVDGNCIDMPSEPPESTYKEKVKAKAYPCRDVNHMIWVYMGPRDVPPPFPAFEINTLPPENVAPPNIMMEEANWMQNMEGDLDTVHLDWVHRKLSEDAPYAGVGNPGFWNPDPLPPRLDVVPTPYGAYYTAMRTLEDGRIWHRINQFLFPFHTMISSGHYARLRSFVPLDDEWAMLISQTGSVSGPLSEETLKQLNAEEPFKDWGGYVERTNDPRTYFYTKANRHNDYFMDRKIAKESLMIGIPFIGNLQDRAMTELMTGANGEPLYDRTQEHLGTSDAMIIAVRRQLIGAAEALRDKGEVPANVDDVQLGRVRCATVLLPEDADWIAETEVHRNADSGAPVAYEKPLVQS